MLEPNIFANSLVSILLVALPYINIFLILSFELWFCAFRFSFTIIRDTKKVRRNKICLTFQIKKKLP